MNSKDKAIQLAKRMLVDSIYRSANVEGLGTTFPDTYCIINNIKTNTTYEEVYFIIGMKRGWQYIINNLGNPNSLLCLRDLHEVCCKFIVKDAGNLRTDLVRISGTSYIPEVPNTDTVYSELNRIDAITDPVNKALVLFSYITRTQPFYDGNKRMAQLMANKVLIENGVGIMSIPIEDTKEFLLLLVQYYGSNDASALCKFIRSKCITYV